MKALALLVTTWLLAGCHDPRPVELPLPSGSMAIGRQSVHWVDSSRPETMTDAPDDRRELTVHVWYPALSTEAGQSAPYVEQLQTLVPVLDARTKQALALVRGHARDAAAPVEQPERLPLLVLSHGDDMLSAEYSFLLEELVSHGFVVAAIDHAYDARAVRLANGQTVGFAANRWPALPPASADGKPTADTAYALFYRERVQVRARDASFVVDQLLAGDAMLVVSGRIDAERIGFLGHSVGGVSAGEVCQSDARFKACLNLDGDSGTGPFYLDAQGRAFAQPYMMLTKPFDVPDVQLARWGLTRDAWLTNLEADRERFFGAVLGGSYRIVINGASHDSFSDDAFVYSRLDDHEPDKIQAHQQRMLLIRSLTLAFFDQVLMQEPSELLEGGPLGSTAVVESWAAQTAQ